MRFLLFVVLIACSPIKDNSDYLIKKEDGTWVCETTGPYSLQHTQVLYNCQHVLTGKKVKSIKVTPLDAIYEVSENTL